MFVSTAYSFLRATGVETGGDGGAVAAVASLRHSDAALTRLSALLFSAAVRFPALATALQHTTDHSYNML